MTRDEIAENYPDVPLLFLDPSSFDKAIVGIVSQFNSPVVCYDQSKVIEILMKEDGMEEDEAWEYYYFNMTGAWVGEYTPAFLETL